MIDALFARIQVPVPTFAFFAIFTSDDSGNENGLRVRTKSVSLTSGNLFSTALKKESRHIFKATFHRKNQQISFDLTV